MGLNLAVCILLGSISMLLTDVQSINEDRHICMAMGVLIHFFYQAAGAWVCTLAYASFSAITSGKHDGWKEPIFEVIGNFLDAFRRSS